MQGHIENSDFLRVKSTTTESLDGISQPFALKDAVSIHLFTTEAPCGDASMELLMNQKDTKDATPWSLSLDASQHEIQALRGRGYFSELGAVRRKPARADAENTLSKSCSDKLALKQFTGLLSFPIDVLVERTENTFLNSIVVYADQYNATGYNRAFGRTGRLKNTGSSLRYFEVNVLAPDTPRFRFARDLSLSAPSKASNISAVWIRGCSKGDEPTIEVLINGVKQGFQQLDSRLGKQSIICRRQMWLRASTLSELSASRAPALESFAAALRSATYHEAKSTDIRASRATQKVMAQLVLRPWPNNPGDDDWSLNTAVLAILPP